MKKNWESIRELYNVPLSSTRTGPLYNAFSYPTKISPEAIALFIATHTKPGDVVLDTFAGSGTTGLAVKLCDKPTNAMVTLAKAMNVEPVWGPRNAHLCEIGILGSFVSKALCSPPDPNKFMQAVNKLLLQAKTAVGWIYDAKDNSDRHGSIRHIIWSDVLICPECKNEETYWYGAVKRAPLAISNTFCCAICNYSCKINSCERAIEVVEDEFGGVIERRKRVPVYLYGTTGKEKWDRVPSQEDFVLIKKINDTPLPSNALNKKIIWGDLYRTGYHKGIERLHHFYTKRNFLALTTLWNLVEQFDNDLQDALRLLILSYNSSHATLMSRVVVKKNQNDFVLTGAQSGVLYVSGLPVEKNVLEGVSRKAKSIADAFRLVHDSQSKVVVHNVSSKKIELPDNSVDYVFTDPPFGDYIPYAEINQINELWLGKTTDREEEIIVSSAQDKNVLSYGKMMASVFGEITRVLKPEGLTTVVFHSAHINIWRALTSAYTNAGLSVKATSILDKLQGSFKQVVSEVSVKGDPLILLSKDEKSKKDIIDVNILVNEIIQNSWSLDPEEREPQRLYSRFITKCLELGLEVGMDAKSFYSKIREVSGEIA